MFSSDLNLSLFSSEHMIQVVILIKLFWLWRFFDKSARECNHNHFCNECNNKEYASELRVSFSELSKNPHGDTILKDPATSRKLFWGSLSKLYQGVSFHNSAFCLNFATDKVYTAIFFGLAICSIDLLSRICNFNSRILVPAQTTFFRNFSKIRIHPIVSSIDSTAFIIGLNQF